MANVKSLTWNDRLALIDHFKPSDEKICSVFEVTQLELDTARRMMSTGTLLPTKNIDVMSYSGMFVTGSATATTKPINKSSISTIKKTADSIQPETATKQSKIPQKRGRKGDKIAIAFEAIPETPINAETFAADHAVSIAVLRQSKRFDKSPELGTVKVKKDKASGDLMIWREATTN